MNVNYKRMNHKTKWNKKENLDKWEELEGCIGTTETPSSTKKKGTTQEKGTGTSPSKGGRVLWAWCSNRPPWDLLVGKPVVEKV